MLLLCLAVLFTSPACGQEYPEGILDRDAVIAAAQDVTPETFPNADAVLVDDHIIVQYNADGSASRWDDTVMKVLTEKGKREQQSQSFHYSEPYSKVEVTLVEVIKPDGTVIPVDVAEQGREMVDPSQMYSNIYDPRQKVYQVGIPDLEIGDMVRYVFVKRTVKALMPGQWCDYEMLEYTSPIKRFVYEVYAPKDHPLERITLDNDVDDSVTYTADEVDGRLRYRWEARNVPRMFPEPSMPAYYTVVQRVMIGTIPDWETVSRWYWEVCEPRIKSTTPAMKQKVEELTADLDDRQAKIEAIFYWVAQKVRYMGITTETDAPGHEPHDVHITFENKYGVCRDKAGLLVAMLRLAGLDAQMVTIHAGAKLHPDAPRPYFNHAIVAVREPDDSWQLMDCTSESATQLLPTYLSNKSYVVSTQEGEGLSTSPIPPAEDNCLRVDSTGALTDAGVLTLTSTIHFDGYEANWHRSYFARIQPKERREYFERYIKDALPGATLKSFEMVPADMHDMSQPLRVDLELQIDDFVVAGDRASTFRPPLFGGKLGMAQYLFRRLGLDERKYPLETDITCGVRETLKIDLPATLAVGATMPTFDAIDDPMVSWSKSLEIVDGALVGRSDFLIHAIEFSPAEYLQLKDHLRTMEFNGRKLPIFLASGEATPGMDLVGPDDGVLILDQDTRYEIKDAHNWTQRDHVRKKILTHAGTKASAELKFDYNTAWEDVRVTEATVTAPDGTVKSIRDEEINLMDAEWVAAAPRYPAGKTLVVNLPGVEIGSVIDYEVVRECRDRPFFSTYRVFGFTDPIVRMTLQIIAPTDLPLTIVANQADTLTATEETKGQTTVRTWSFENHRAIKRERYYPPPWSFRPTVGVSCGQWNEYAALVNDAFEAAVADAEAAAAKARELVDGLETDQAKVIAIRDFVARNIRPLGMGPYAAYFEPSIDELPLTAITPADQVLAEGYGGGVDRAVMLTAMLRAAGLAPQFVLASSYRELPGLRKILAELPETDTFSTPLVRVMVDGQAVILNDSDQYAVFGATENDQQLALTLPGATIGLIDGPEDRRAKEYLAFHFRLTADGDARIEKVRRWYGHYVERFNRMYTEMPPEEFRREHLEAVARIAQSAKPDGEMAMDFSRYPATAHLPVLAAKYAVRDGDHLYLTLPGDLIELRLPGTDTRENDICWYRPDVQTVQITVELPEGFTDVLLAPESFEWIAPADLGSVSCRVRQEADPPRLIIDYDVDLGIGIIPVADYDTLLEIERLLTHPRNRTIILKRSR